MALEITVNYPLYLAGSVATWFILRTITRSKIVTRVLLSLFGMMLGSIMMFNFLETTEITGERQTYIVLGTQFFLVLVFTSLFKRQLIDPLKTVIRHTNRIAEGDLKENLDPRVRGIGETQTLISSTNVLTSRFQTMISNIKNSADLLGQAAEELAAGSEEVSATTEEVTATIQTIAEGAAEQVRRLDEVSSILTEMVNVTEESIRQVGITSKITLDLAEQTNLVSLNAAIEAAKASGQSEGFQVVANHVRQLSVESKSAANAVNSITKQISSRMRESVEDIVSAVDKIASVAENTAASSEEAAAAAEEQSAALQEITQQAQRLSDLSDATERNIQEFKVN